MPLTLQKVVKSLLLLFFFQVYCITVHLSKCKFRIHVKEEVNPVDLITWPDLISTLTLLFPLYYMLRPSMLSVTINLSLLMRMLFQYMFLHNAVLFGAERCQQIYKGYKKLNTRAVRSIIMKFIYRHTFSQYVKKVYIVKCPRPPPPLYDKLIFESYKKNRVTIAGDKSYNQLVF